MNDAPAARLFLAQVEGDFNPARNLALGPWSFVGSEDVYPAWESLEFTDPFPTADELVKAELVANRLGRHLIHETGTALNSRHGVSYGPAFGHALLAPWLLALVHGSWVRFQYLRAFAARHGNEPLSVTMHTDDVDWAFRDAADFRNRGTRGHPFNLWLTSRLLAPIAPAAWKQVAAVVDSDSLRAPVKVVSPPSRTNPLKRAVRTAMGRLRFSDVLGVSTGNLPLSLYLSALPARAPDPWRGPQPDPAAEEAVPGEYLTELRRLIPATMPKSYSDDFADLDGAARRQRYRPGKVMIEGAAKINDRARFVLAHAREAGERVVHCLHGGNSGTAATYLSGEVSVEPATAVVSWGWEEHAHYGSTYLPLPSPFLTRFADRHAERNDSLILVGGRMSLQLPSFRPNPQPAATVRYRQWKSQFVEALPSEIRSQLAYRPYSRANQDLADAADLRRRIGDFETVDGDLHGAMLGCRVLVLDHPGTTMNIALAANVPTVCYWNPEDWMMAPQVRRAFAELREQEIVFDTPEAAAAKIEHIWDNVPRWWQRGDTQAVRRRWCRLFARTDRYWWYWWLQALWHVSTGAIGRTADYGIADRGGSKDGEQGERK